MIVDQELENKEIAKQYKELLRISYQSLCDSDKKMIRLAFDTAVEGHEGSTKKVRRSLCFPSNKCCKNCGPTNRSRRHFNLQPLYLHDVVEDTACHTSRHRATLWGMLWQKLYTDSPKFPSLKKDKRHFSCKPRISGKCLLTLNDDVLGS